MHYRRCWLGLLRRLLKQMGLGNACIFSKTIKRTRLLRIDFSYSSNNNVNSNFQFLNKFERNLVKYWTIWNSTVHIFFDDKSQIFLKLALIGNYEVISIFESNSFWNEKNVCGDLICLHWERLDHCCLLTAAIEWQLAEGFIHFIQDYKSTWLKK